MLPTGGHCF